MKAESPKVTVASPMQTAPPKAAGSSMQGASLSPKALGKGKDDTYVCKY
jgi:hypothetical protein